MNNLGTVSYAPPSTKLARRLEQIARLGGFDASPIRIVSATAHLLLDERTLSEGLVISDDEQAVRIRHDDEKSKHDNIAHADTDTAHEGAYQFSRAIDVNIPDSHVQLAKAPIRTWLHDGCHASIICLSPAPFPHPKGAQAPPSPGLGILLGLQSRSVLLECLSAAFASPAAVAAPGIALWCWELDSAACEQYAADVSVLSGSPFNQRGRDSPGGPAAIGDPAGSWRNLLAEVLQGEARATGTTLFGGPAGVTAGPSRGNSARLATSTPRARASSLAAWGSRGLTVATMAEAIAALHAAFRRSRLWQAHRGEGGDGAVPHLFVRLGLQHNPPSPLTQPPQQQKLAPRSPAKSASSLSPGPERHRSSKSGLSDPSSGPGTPSEPLWTTCDLVLVSYPDVQEQSAAGGRSGRHGFSRSSSGNSSGRYAGRSGGSYGGGVLGSAGELLTELVSRQEDNSGVPRPLGTTQPGRPGSALCRRLASLLVGSVVPHLILTLPPRGPPHKPSSPPRGAAPRSPPAPRLHGTWLREVLKLGSSLRTIRTLLTIGDPPPSLYGDNANSGGTGQPLSSGALPAPTLLPPIGALSGCAEGDRPLASRLLRRFYLEQATAAAAAELKSSGGGGGGGGGGSGSDVKGSAAATAAVQMAAGRVDDDGNNDGPAGDRPVVTTFAIAVTMSSSPRSSDTSATMVASSSSPASPRQLQGPTMSTFRLPCASAEWATATAAIGPHAVAAVSSAGSQGGRAASTGQLGRGGDDSPLTSGILRLQRRLESMQRARQAREADAQGGYGSDNTIGAPRGGRGSGGSCGGGGSRAQSPRSRSRPQSPRVWRGSQEGRHTSNGSIGSVPPPGGCQRPAITATATTAATATAAATATIIHATATSTTTTAASTAEERLQALRARFDSLYAGLVAATSTPADGAAALCGAESIPPGGRQQDEEIQAHVSLPSQVSTGTQTARKAVSPTRQIGSQEVRSRDLEGYRELHAVRQQHGIRSPTTSHKVGALPSPPPAASDFASPVNSPASPHANSGAADAHRYASAPTSPLATRGSVPPASPTLVGPCVGCLLGCLPIHVKPRFVVLRPQIDAVPEPVTSGATAVGGDAAARTGDAAARSSGGAAVTSSAAARTNDATSRTSSATAIASVAATRTSDASAVTNAAAARASDVTARSSGTTVMASAAIERASDATSKTNGVGAMTSAAVAIASDTVSRSSSTTTIKTTADDARTSDAIPRISSATAISTAAAARASDATARTSGATATTSVAAARTDDAAFRISTATAITSAVARASDVTSITSSATAIASAAATARTSDVTARASSATAKTSAAATTADTAAGERTVAARGPLLAAARATAPELSTAEPNSTRPSATQLQPTSTSDTVIAGPTYLADLTDAVLTQAAGSGPAEAGGSATTKGYAWHAAHAKGPIGKLTDDSEQATSEEGHQQQRQRQQSAAGMGMQLPTAEAPLAALATELTLLACPDISNGADGMDLRDRAAPPGDAATAGGERRSEPTILGDVGASSVEAAMGNIRAVSVDRRDRPATWGAIGASDVDGCDKEDDIGASGVGRRDRAITLGFIGVPDLAQRDVPAAAGEIRVSVVERREQAATVVEFGTPVIPPRDVATASNSPRASRDSPLLRGLERLLADSDEDSRAGSSRGVGHDNGGYANAFAPSAFAPPPVPDVSFSKPHSPATSSSGKQAPASAAQEADLSPILLLAPVAPESPAAFGADDATSSVASVTGPSHPLSGRYTGNGASSEGSDPKTAPTSAGGTNKEALHVKGLNHALDDHTMQLSRQNEALMSALERAAASSDALQTRLYELQLEVLEARAASAVAATAHKAEVAGLWRRLRSAAAAGAAVEDAALVAEGQEAGAIVSRGGEGHGAWSPEGAGGPAAAALEALVGAYEEQIAGLQQQVADLLAGQTDLALLCAEQELAAVAEDAARRRRRQARQGRRKAAVPAAPTQAAGRAAAPAQKAAASPMRRAVSPGTALRLVLAQSSQRRPVGQIGPVQAGQQARLRQARSGNVSYPRPRRRSLDSLPPPWSPVASPPGSIGRVGRSGAVSRSVRDLRPADFTTALDITDCSSSNPDNSSSSESEAGWLGTGLDPPTSSHVRASHGGEPATDARWRRCRQDMRALRTALRMSQHREEQLQINLKNTQQQLRAALVAARLMAGEAIRRRWREHQVMEASHQLAAARDAAATATQSRDEAQREVQRLRTEQEVMSAQLNEMRKLTDSYAEFVQMAIGERA